MEQQGKVIVVLPAREGDSSRGHWKAQSFVIETHEQYPKQMVFDVFGEDRLNQFNIKTGDEINVKFDITAHEYNGRWFNNVRAWDVQHVDPTAAAAGAYNAPQSYAQTPQQGLTVDQSSEPFKSAPQAQKAGAAAQQQTPFPPAGDAQNGDSSDDLPF